MFRSHISRFFMFCYSSQSPTPQPSPYPTITPYPTYPPTISRAPSTPFPTEPVVPTPEPTSPCEGNTPNWRDMDGFGCDWWEMMDMPGCPLYGDMYVGDMGAANENCCYCAGTGVSAIISCVHFTLPVISSCSQPFAVDAFDAKQAPSPALTSFPTF